ncbi:hypothetical protein BHM03_00031560 [Ensete ventricosum]|nr:hypothetical protein BHM03_00031560 [Ensete ventricosum]
MNAFALLDEALGRGKLDRKEGKFLLHQRPSIRSYGQGGENCNSAARDGGVGASTRLGVERTNRNAPAAVRGAPARSLPHGAVSYRVLPVQREYILIPSSSSRGMPTVTASSMLPNTFGTCDLWGAVQIRLTRWSL